MQTQEYDMKAIGKRIKSGLADADMSQEELAERIGVSRWTVSEWILGRSRPKITDAAKVCDVFGWPLDVLATRKPLVTDAS